MTAHRHSTAHAELTRTIGIVNSHDDFPLKRGFSEQDLRQIFRDNYLGVMAAVAECVEAAG